MTTTRMMLDRSEELAREERAAVQAHKRTEYAIMMTSTSLFVGANFKWVERAHALRFDFMTTALAYAVELGLDLEAYSVEPV